MKNKVFLIYFFFLSSIVSAQIQHPNLKMERGSRPQRSWLSVEQKGKPVLFVTMLIDGGKIDYDSISLANSDEKKQALFKESPFRGKEKFSGITIRLKPDKIVLSMDEVIKAYNITGKDRNLPIVVDDRYLNYPDNAYAVKSSIAYVKVETHYYTKKPVIYIRTTKPLPERRPF